jgi:hypothetical protein
MILKCADYRKVPYKGLKPRTKKKAAVAHTNGSKGPIAGSLFGWWSQVATSGSQVGAHVQVMKSGKVEQYVDTDLIVYHAFAASDFAVGIETEDDGAPSTAWTDAQMEGIVAVLQELEVPALILPDRAADGLGWHEQYDTWNENKHDCPSTTREGQILTEIIPALRGGGDDVKWTGEEYDAQAAVWGEQRRWKGVAKPTAYTAGDGKNRLDSAVAGWEYADKLIAKQGLDIPVKP